MSSFDSSLRLFEELDGLADGFIEEAMLPDHDVQPRKQPHALLRFMRSGAAVAILCTVVSLGVLVAIVQAGLNGSHDWGNSAPGADQPQDNRPNYQEGMTDEPVTLPEESVRVPAGTRSEDEAGLYYVSYGDGTCICMGFVQDREQTVLTVPNYSPDGDVVTAIYSYAFRNCLSLKEVTLPAGLRSLDHNAFPMEAPIYHAYGNVLYLGSAANPYLVAVATADGRPGATSLHPNTRILACHALTYEVGAYFSMAWADSLPAYEDAPVFTLPSGLIHIGEYALLDVGRDVAYKGNLVSWDSLTADGYAGLIRTADGRGVTITCMDGVTESVPTERRRISLDTTASYENGILYGGYDTYSRYLNPDYYAWLQNPDAFPAVPDQFVTVSSVFGSSPRTLTREELESVAFRLSAGASDGTLADFAAAYNEDPASFCGGRTVVLIPLTDTLLCVHTVTDITVTDGRIHVTLTASAASTGTGSRFLLIPVPDETGSLAEATVTFSVES